jgi:type IV pilus assembly protein PilC
MAPEFEYTAKNKNGETVKGTIEAEDKSAIATQLRSQGFYVTEIKEKKASRDLKDVFNIK